MNQLIFIDNMFHNIHADFILTPIHNILMEGINSCNGIGDGIETYPLSEYILSSMFLKLTGAQEQKLKCICWEMGTNDYKFRQELIKNNLLLGQISAYKDKNSVYKILISKISEIKKCNSYKIDNNTIDNLIKKSINKIHELFEETNILIWVEQDFQLYDKKIKNFLLSNHVLHSKKNLFESTLQDIYKEIVYNHRNLLAHNTTSYQRNLPKLVTLESSDYYEYNYFFRYTLLVLIDLIFIHLYKVYKDAIEQYDE